VAGIAGHENFRSIIKEALELAGLKNKRVVLLCQDWQISNEEMYEDLNCLVKHREISSLFTNEEKDSLFQALRSANPDLF